MYSFLSFFLSFFLVLFFSFLFLPRVFVPGNGVTPAQFDGEKPSRSPGNECHTTLYTACMCISIYPGTKKEKEKKSRKIRASLSRFSSLFFSFFLFFFFSFFSPSSKRNNIPNAKVDSLRFTDDSCDDYYYSSAWRKRKKKKKKRNIFLKTA